MKNSIQQNFPSILAVTFVAGLGGALIWDQTSPKMGAVTESTTDSEHAVTAQDSGSVETASITEKNEKTQQPVAEKQPASPGKAAKPAVAKKPAAEGVTVVSKAEQNTEKAKPESQPGEASKNLPTLAGNTITLAQAIKPINDAQPSLNFGCFILGESCPSDKPNCGVEELISTPSFFPFMNVGIAMMRTMGNQMINDTAMGIPVTGALNVMFKMTPRVKVPPPYEYKYKPSPWFQPKS